MNRITLVSCGIRRFRRLLLVVGFESRFPSSP